MLQRVRHLLEMIRFSHTVFALPFALLSAVMAWTAPSSGGASIRFQWIHLTGILVCMVGARSAAMAFNRWVDHHIDAQNPRTQSRHLPAGILSRSSVLAFLLASSLVYFAGTALFWPNWLPAVLSAPVLAFLLSYSYAKRFTSAAHFWLGAALLLAPLCAWIALRGEVLLTDPADILPAALLGAAVLLWVSGFDIIYACQDAEFDRRVKLRSVPARWGIAGALRMAAACHLLMIVVLAAIPVVCPNLQLGWIYGSGLAAVATLLLYEHWLVRPNDLTRVNLAFFHVNSVVSLGLFLITTIDLLT